MNDRRNAHAVRCEDSSASYAQRSLFFLLAVASAIFLSSLFLPAPAMAQTVDPCAATGMELLNTDIWGYQSGDTVHFDGTGYAPNCSYPITVIEPTNMRVSTDLVTTDAAGNLAYDYLIVHGVQEVYLARVVGNDGNDLASVMFSDAAPCDATVPSGLFPTIQSAVSALPNANPGTACVITVLAGTYNEAISVGTAASGKNLGAGVNDSLRYIIQADPAAAPGAVVINPFSPVNKGLQGFNVQKSQFITIAGFGLTGANPSGGSAILLQGGGSTNHDITIEANLIYNNAGGDTGSNSSDGGINVQGNGNVRTWIVNNLIRNNGRNGISIGATAGIGPVYIVNNTIYSNGFSGISTISGATIHVINNLLIRNGVNGPVAQLARYGLNCTSCNSSTALNRFVENNLFYANARGDLNDVTHWIESSPPDSGNYTPSASWTAGAVVTGNTTGITSCVFPPACSTVQADTTIFTDTTNFRLKTTAPISPATDTGLNSYVNGGLEWVPSTSNARAEAPQDDFEGDLRPQNGGVSTTVDIGYDESPAAADSTPPDTSITTSPTNPSSSSIASFSFTGSDNVTPSGSLTFECQLDGGGFTTCTSPKSYSGLADGSHTFDVRAKDAANNVDPSPASFTWTIDTSAPDTSITANPSDPSNSSSASFSFTSPDGSATFECQLDGGSFSACPSPKTYAGLSDSSHTFQVRARDAAGNVDPSPASFTWTIDTVAPDTSITSNPSNPSNSSSASFSFTSPDGSATFECQLDSGGFAACASPQNYPGPLADGSHTFDVRAKDAAGNVDPSPASFTWTIDTTAPETTIDSGPVSPTSSTSASFTFHSDDGSATFECDLDGGGFAACASPQNYPGPLADGSHTFKVRAIDAVGNTDATPASFTWTVDTSAPDTIIDSMPVDPTNQTSATFAFHATEPSSTLECSLDGSAFAACTSPTMYTGLADGSHTFQVRAKDTAGNTDATPASFTWTVDTSAPDTLIDSGPADPTNSNTAMFVFHASDAGSTFQCSLDGGAFTSCTSPATYSGLAEGNHTFDVEATDSAGNTDPTPGHFEWTIDTTAPDTTITSNPSNPSNSSSASFSFVSSEAGSSFACSLDGGAYVACTSPTSYSGLANGSHTFAVRATDAAGNTDPTPATYTWTVNTVTPYTFTGFFQPIDNLPTVNNANAGQAIPVKWTLMLNGVPVSNPASFVSLTSTQVSCGSTAVTGDTIETYTGASGLQYLGSGNWQFNWKTPKTYAGTCRTMVLNLSDGSMHYANFKFK